MGKISKAVLGKTTGKVGGVAFRTWRGLDLVQTYAEENKSNTEKQKLQRSLFADMNKDIRNFLCPVRLGFQHLAAGSTQYAEFVGTNYSTLVVNGAYQPSKLNLLQLSKGGLRVPDILSAEVSSGEVEVTWHYSDINPCGKNNPTDTVVVVVAVVDAQGHVIDQAVSSAAPRSTGTLTLTIPTSWGTTAANFRVYAFAYNDEDASDTSYHVGE